MEVYCTIKIWRKFLVQVSWACATAITPGRTDWINQHIGSLKKINLQPVRRNNASKSSRRRAADFVTIIIRSLISAFSPLYRYATQETATDLLLRRDGGESLVFLLPLWHQIRAFLARNNGQFVHDSRAENDAKNEHITPMNEQSRHHSRFRDECKWTTYRFSCRQGVLTSLHHIQHNLHTCSALASSSSSQLSSVIIHNPSLFTARFTFAVPIYKIS